MGRNPVQTPLGALLDLGTLPHYNAPGDHWIEVVKRQWLTSSEGSSLPDNGPKLAMGSQIAVKFFQGTGDSYSIILVSSFIRALNLIERIPVCQFLNWS